MTDVKVLLMVASARAGGRRLCDRRPTRSFSRRRSYAGWSVSGETIVRWNQNAVTIANGPALPMMRELAMVHIAMHDASNAVDRHYETYSRIARDRRADPALAAAAAAHDALVALKPDEGRRDRRPVPDRPRAGHRRGHAPPLAHGQRGHRQRDPRAPRRRRLERKSDLHLRPGRASRLPAGAAGRHQRRLPALAERHPLRHDIRQSVPPGGVRSGSRQTDVGPRLQRGQGVRPD